MTFRNCSRGFGALAALTLVVAACSTTDDIGGVADSGITTDAASSELAPPDSANPAATSVIVDDSVASTDAPDDAPDELEREGVLVTGSTGDYTVVFPGEPTGTPLPIQLPTGSIEAEAFIYEQGIDAAYFTSAFDYPPGLTDDDPQVVLTGARDGAVSNVGATLRDSDFVELDGVPGVRFTFDVDGGIGESVIYFQEPRLYQTFALGEISFVDQYGAFVDTFSFTGAGS